MNLDLSNPIVLIIGGILLLAILYFWNKRNATNQRQRRTKNFRNSYYERKKDREQDSTQ
jgi:type II secretory pathway pseudopilin PulG